MRSVVRWLVCLAGLVAAGASFAQAQDTPRRQVRSGDDYVQTYRAPSPVPVIRETQGERLQRDRVNNWSLGLAAGRTEGAPLQFAAELARVLDDGDNMRVIPMVTRGPFDNIFDLLYLRGVDAAIVYGDVLDHFKNKPELAASVKRVNSVLSLFPSEVHIFVRPEINSLQDLEGKVVNFNTQGTAAAFSGPIIFSQLGIKVQETFIPHSSAMEKMRNGPEVAATFWVSSKPLAPFLKGKFPPGFKFLPIEYTDKLEYYTPAYLEAADYPALIPEGTRIATISVPAVLAVNDTPGDAAKKLRLSRFVDYLFERFDRLQKEPGYHEKWKDVNLAANVPGWKRYPPLQEKLDKLAAQKPETASVRAQSKGVPTSAAEQEKLFQQFLEWHRKQARQ